MGAGRKLVTEEAPRVGTNSDSSTVLPLGGLEGGHGFPIQSALAKPTRSPS